MQRAAATVPCLVVVLPRERGAEHQAKIDAADAAPVGGGMAGQCARSAVAALPALTTSLGATASHCVWCPRVCQAMRQGLGARPQQPPAIDVRRLCYPSKSIRI
jgi:hypothetical protein